MKWMVIGMFSLLVIGRWYFRVKSHSVFDSYKGKEPVGMVVYRIILGILQGMVTVVYIYEKAPSWMIHLLPLGVATAGMVLGWLCLGLIFWAHEALGENFSPSVGKAYRLVKEGPYAYIRHPIYVGYIGLFVAVYLMTGWWMMSLLGEMILFSLVVWRLPLEEAYLEETFGEHYREYARKTKRFLPWIV
ncbi:MAG: isoprenylcysteine carboxylmethyltransferase family protein [Brevinematales bacterium]|nr:isoprenylcysteine carboxylmethyltransferase family protein [Brevinematales bacterium]